MVMPAVYGGPDVTVALAMIVGIVLVPPTDVLVAVTALAVYLMDSVENTWPTAVSCFLNARVFLCICAVCGAAM